MDFLITLDQFIRQRKQNMPEGSYTTDLFTKGTDRICRKIGEEAAELIVAAKNDDRAEITNEAADLVYHLMVLLHQHQLSLADVQACLKDRHQTK